jgi:hypothetical protein
MKLKEQIKIFDESFNDSSGEPTKTPVDLFAGVEQLQREIRDKDKIIENLKNESTELKNKISNGEKEKFTILEELKKSGWLENKVTLSSKYKGKLKTILGEIKVVDTNIISMLTAVGRKKQGNQKLNWDSWLKIPENRYLYAVNEDIAKGVCRETNTLIERTFAIESVRGSGGQTTKFNNYSLTFDRTNGEYVTTDFDPDTYELNKGFTVSYWVRPDEQGGTMAALGRRAGTNEKFFFGISKTAQNRIWVGVGRTGTLNQAGATYPGMNNGEWYHWVITYNGDSNYGGNNDRKIYMNGDLIYESDIRWYNTANTGGGENIYFGARNNNGNYTKGWACGLDEVAIFDEEKDSDWISSTYNGGTPADLQSESGLVGYWRFEEGSGTTVSDLSGNGNDGTLTTNNTGLPIWSDDTP